MEEHRGLRDELVDKLLSALRQGEWPVGARLPSERAFAAQYGMSRTTVRDALRTLAGLGVVRIERGRGVFVEESGTAVGDSLISMVRFTDFRSLFEIRKVFEPQMAAWAAQRAEAWEADRLLAIVLHALPESLQRLDGSARAAVMWETDQKFHHEMARLSKNPVAVRMMLNLLDLLEQSRQRSREIPGRAERSAIEHLRVAEAIVARNADMARETMLVHLAGVEEAIVNHMRIPDDRMQSAHHSR